MESTKGCGAPSRGRCFCFYGMAGASRPIVLPAGTTGQLSGSTDYDGCGDAGCASGDVNSIGVALVAASFELAKRGGHSEQGSLPDGAWTYDSYSTTTLGLHAEKPGGLS